MFDDDYEDDADDTDDWPPTLGTRGETPIEFFASHPYFHLNEYLMSRSAGARRALDYHLAQCHLVTVRRGTYMWRKHAKWPDPYLLGSRLVGDIGVIAYETALWFHRHDTIRPKRVIMISSVRLPAFEHGDVTYVATRQPHRLSSERITSGGVKWERRLGLRVDVCTIERAFVDCLDRLHLGPGLDALWTWLLDHSTSGVRFRFDPHAMVEHALALGNEVTIARLGLMLERHPDALRNDPLVQRLRDRKPMAATQMDPRVHRRDCVYSPWWHLYVPARLYDRMWGRG